MGVVTEKNKTFLNNGDIVKFKGVSDDNSLEMKVQRMVWVKEEDGRLRKSKSGGNVPEGVLVGWHNELGDWIEKVVDTRSLYKVEHSISYFLLEAKKLALRTPERENLIKSINESLNYC